MKLYEVTYHLASDNESPLKSMHILCEGIPSDKKIVKRLNMERYCGFEMEDKEYKEFVIGLGNFREYIIEDVKEVGYLKF